MQGHQGSEKSQELMMEKCENLTKSRKHQKEEPGNTVSITEGLTQGAVGEKTRLIPKGSVSLF